MWPCWRQRSTANHTPRWHPARGLTVPGGTRGPEACPAAPRLIGLRWAGLVLTLLALFLRVSPAAADSQVFSPVPARERGVQVDAALFSPQPIIWPASTGVGEPPQPGSETATPGARIYVVQAGDTLSAIAARFQVDAADLASLNRLQNPDLIGVGQRLMLDAANPSSSGLPASAEQSPVADTDLLRVQVWPWPPVQGQTLAVWIDARRPITFELSLDGTSYPVISQGLRGWALVPLPSLMRAGDHTLDVTAGDTRTILTIPVEAGSFEMYHIPASVSQPILGQSQKVQAETARLKELFGQQTPSGWTPSSRFSAPLEGEYAHTSPFGSRRTYEPSPVISAHEGEDLSAPAGTAVHAPAAGVVVLAEPLFVRGNAVVLDHGNGVFTGYWHMEELDVQRGDRVERGQLLGRVGSTGLSTGAHLHWELRVDGVPVDPLQWLEK
jgi:murein DD-endopeptidase MepM/ murein hydrolase activator NlpD